MSTTATHPMIDMARERASDGRDRLLKTFSFIPDDKLDFTPGPNCKSAIRLVAHCAVSNGFFEKFIKGEPLPPGDPKEMFAKAEEMEKSLTTRESAVAALNTSCDDVLRALDGMSPESVDTMVPSFFGEFPMTFWMNLPGRHMDNHAAQIDYIQTCWGDMEWHI